MTTQQPDIHALQQAIRREKVLRARAMTEDERFLATLDQIDVAFSWMLDGVKQQIEGISETEANIILGQRLNRQRQREDKGLYIPAPQRA